MERALTDRERPERLRAAQRNRRKNRMRPRTNLGAVGKSKIPPERRACREGEGDAEHVPGEGDAAVARGGADGAGPLQRQREVVQLALRLGQARAGGALDGQPRGDQRPRQQHARRRRHCLRRLVLSRQRVVSYWLAPGWGRVSRWARDRQVGPAAQADLMIASIWNILSPLT
jgi:hypothetical protein